MLDDKSLPEAGIIPWGAPVPSFGDASVARVATLGLNPSNREFVDPVGEELQGDSRRFHTLSSLGLCRWSDASPSDLKLIWESCRDYFSSNPYDTWFRQLDFLMSGTGYSYYGPTGMACHLDLVPFATSSKWTELTRAQRSSLFSIAGDGLGRLLKDSSIELLILNGNSVVLNFERSAAVSLERTEITDWILPRRSCSDVSGIAYLGAITRLFNVQLDREIVVAGFNHNIQSSFGVTRSVRHSIQSWITDIASKVLA
jgi:hypothetical protein